MKAAVIKGKGVVEVEEFPTPSPKAGEVLLKVDACALCGTDQRVLRGEKAISVQIIGHEIAGTVVELGAGVKGVKVGGRYALQAVIGCGHCPPCKANRQNLCDNTFTALGYAYNGGFAEYIIMPKAGVEQGCLIPIPDSMSAAVGTLLEPLSCSVNGLRCMPIEEMETVVIFGAGVIGVLNALVAHARGAKEVIVMNRTQPRLDIIKKLGLPVDHVVNMEENDPVEWIRKHTNGVGADAVILSASDKSLVPIGMKMLRRDGHLSLFAGMNKEAPMEPLNVNLIHYDELHLHGANSSVRRDYIEAAEMLTDGRVDGNSLITHTFKLADFKQAMATQLDRASGSMKIIIEP